MYQLLKTTGSWKLRETSHEKTIVQKLGNPGNAIFISSLQADEHSAAITDFLVFYEDVSVWGRYTDSLDSKIFYLWWIDWEEFPY